VTGGLGKEKPMGKKREFVHFQRTRQFYRLEGFFPTKNSVSRKRRKGGENVPGENPNKHTAFSGEAIASERYAAKDLEKKWKEASRPRAEKRGQPRKGRCHRLASGGGRKPFMRDVWRKRGGAPKSFSGGGWRVRSKGGGHELPDNNEKKGEFSSSHRNLLQ